MSLRLGYHQPDAIRAGGQSGLEPRSAGPGAGRERLVYLESIRGIAALIVVVSHLVLGFAPKHWSDYTLSPLSRFWFDGNFAVLVFFVLSGFVLSNAFFAGGGQRALQSAALRRYTRLVIPVAISVFASYLLLTFDVYSNLQAAEMMGQGESWLSMWNNFEPSLSSAIIEAGWRAMIDYANARNYNNVLWTMQVEFMGSLFVFSFLALCGQARNRWIVYLCVAAVLYKLRALYLLDFLSGVVLCDSLNYMRPRFRLLGLPATAIALASPIAAATTEDWLRSLTTLAYIGDLRHLFAMLVVAGVLYSPPLQRLLSRRPFVLLGAASFPLYLFHLLVQFSLGCGVYLALRQYTTHLAAASIASLVSVLASLACAFIGAYTVEPLSLWASRVAYTRLFAPRPQAS